MLNENVIQIDLNFRHALGIQRHLLRYKVKKFIFITVMSDIGLPDFGDRDLGIDLEKGIFLRGKVGKKGDNDSNDSGNNSMNTNGSGTIIDFSISLQAVYWFIHEMHFFL